jgi:hypothetical protein
LHFTAAGIRHLLEHLDVDLTRTATYTISDNGGRLLTEQHTTTCPWIADLSERHHTETRTVISALTALAAGDCPVCAGDQLTDILIDARNDLHTIANPAALDTIGRLHRTRTHLANIRNGAGTSSWIVDHVQAIRAETDQFEAHWLTLPADAPADVGAWGRQLAADNAAAAQSADICTIYQNACQEELAELYDDTIGGALPDIADGTTLIGVRNPRAARGGQLILGCYTIGCTDTAAVLQIPAENAGWFIRRFDDDNTTVSVLTWPDTTPVTEQQARTICELAANGTWQDATRTVAALHR